MYALDVVVPVVSRHGWSGAASGWWIVFPLFWVAVFVAVTVLIVRYRSRNRQRGDDRAETVLRERFARGEIDETEYRARLEVLVTGRTRR